MGSSIEWIGSALTNRSLGRTLRASGISYHPVAIVLHDAGADADLLDAFMRTRPQDKRINFSNCSAAGSVLQRPFSYHYGVFASGLIHQYVREQDVAYHAGRIMYPKWS